MRVLVWFSITLLVIPILEVTCIRWMNPPGTPLMLIRRIEASWAGHPYATHYKWLDLRQVPRDFVRCVLTSEDQRFFQHHGFDWAEIRRAREAAKRKGKSPRGASTITQQCARSLFLWQGRSWVRKGLEAYYTFWMETLLSKRRILELYVNVIETGDGVYGIGAAAEQHFHTSAQKLSREQCAMIVAILPNPRHWNPREPDAKLASRQARIIRNEPALRVPAIQ